MTTPVDDEPTLPATRRGFNLGPPEGFIELPLRDDELDSPEHFDPLVDKVAATLGLSPADDAARAAATGLSLVGITAGAGGVDYSGIALYKSPDDPLRPIMLVLSCLTMPSDHQRAEEAVANLLDCYDDEDGGRATRIPLPIGPAAAVITEDQNELELNEEVIPVLTRQVSAWVPDPDGTTIGIVSVMTNSYQDWEYVCDLALDIFDTFEWQPLVD